MLTSVPPLALLRGSIECGDAAHEEVGQNKVWRVAAILGADTVDRLLYLVTQPFHHYLTGRSDIHLRRILILQDVLQLRDARASFLLRGPLASRLAAKWRADVRGTLTHRSFHRSLVTLLVLVGRRC